MGVAPGAPWVTPLSLTVMVVINFLQVIKQVQTQVFCCPGSSYMGKEAASLVLFFKALPEDVEVRQVQVLD